MTTFHAVVWMDHTQAHVLMFDREHVEAQRVKARSQHTPKHGHVGADKAFFEEIAQARGPAALGCPCPTRRRTPLRHPAADLNNDRTAAPTTLEDLARRTGGPTSHRPVACRLASRFHGPHYITAK